VRASVRRTLAIAMLKYLFN